MTILIVIAFIAIAVGYDIYSTRRKSRLLNRNPITNKQNYQINTNVVSVPDGIFFSPKHTWAFLMESGNVRIGIDDFLKSIIGPLSRISAPLENSNVSGSSELLLLEQNNKFISLPSPVSGKLRKINPEILKDPDRSIMGSYVDRWICEVEPSNWKEESIVLMLGEKASEWMRTEFLRLKEFFAFRQGLNQSQNSLGTVLQGGGEIAQHVLKYGDADLWVDFQNDFLNADHVINYAGGGIK